MSKIKEQVDSVSGEVPFPVSSHGKTCKAALQGLFSKDTNPILEHSIQNPQ